MRPAGPALRFPALLVLLALLSGSARAQDGVEVLRGRVLGAGDRPLGGVEVIVTGERTRAVRTTRTRDDGTWAALFAVGEGSYELRLRAIGYEPRALHVARQGEGSAIVAADVRLVVAAVTLQVVSVRATRPPPRRDASIPSVGGIERDVLRAAPFTLEPANLRVLALQALGVRPVLDEQGDTTGFSALGASPEQNTVLVDGSTFDGNTLPRDAIASARLVTTSFDPARGQFAGGQLVATTRSGTDVFEGTLRGGVADRRVAWPDPASPTPVPTTLQASGGVGGPIRVGKAHWFTAFESQRSASDAFTLLDPRGPLLAQRGIHRDTIASATEALQALGVPLTHGDIPAERLLDRHTALARVDLVPSATSSLALRLDAAWQRQGSEGASPWAWPTVAGERTTDRVGLQANGSRYVGGFLDELRTIVQVSSTDATPYLTMPGGGVHVGTRFDDGRTGLTALRFGGGTAALSHETTRRWETTHELSWMAKGSRHRLKIGQLFALTGTRSRSVADPFGGYTYQTLADLAANRPASYVRTLDARERGSGNVAGAAWVGDEWQRTPALRLQYGLRWDVATSTRVPRRNPAVDSLFGLRTDRVPRDEGVSPRVGFTWSPWSRDTAKARAPLKPVTFSGGVGAFRGTIPPARVNALVDQTGLPTATRRLSCAGDATPLPSWDPGATAIPDACLDGTAPVAFSQRQPSVTVFDASYRAPVSWRANLAIAGFRVRGWNVGVAATQSHGRQGESATNANLRRAPAFALADEGGRPVFADPALVVPGTGVVAPGASRTHDAFGPVTWLLSDLRSTATQVDVGLVPPRPLWGKVPFTATYTFMRQRAAERGFGATTAGDPWSVEWNRGASPTHQVVVTTSWRARRQLNVALRTTVWSGTPFTPLVAGDVNGDGAGGDRAFVFGPDAADTTLRAQMAALLAEAPGSVRDCLRAQRGRVAGRNSCSTGWLVRPDLVLDFTPPQDFGYGDRLRLGVTMLNAGAAALRLVGLGRSPLARASATGTPDPVLLHVTGFDAGQRRWRYRVNQQFGEPRAAAAPGRPIAPPFQVQAGLTWKFGGPPRAALARSLGLVTARGEPALSREEVVARVHDLARSPVRPLLDLRDTLGLDSAQVARLETIEARFAARASSALQPLVALVLSRGRGLTDAELGPKLRPLQGPLEALMREARREALALLTAEQAARLPEWYRTSAPAPSTPPAPSPPAPA